jgi:hypothetical protein
VRNCLLSLLLLITALSSGQSRPEQETPAHKSNETQNIQSVSQAQPSAKNEEGKSQTPDRSLPTWSDPFWSNWALVLVGVIAAWIALGTLGDLKEQTAATKISAEAAEKSAEIAEASLKLVEKADVLLDAVSLVHGSTLGGKDARVVLQFRNFGRTKATDVRLRLNLMIEGVPESDCTNIPTVSVGAGETKEVSSARFVQFLTEALAKKIFSGVVGLSFEGEALYRDIFGGSHRSYYTGTWDRGTDTFQIKKQESD